MKGKNMRPAAVIIFVLLLAGLAFFTYQVGSLNMLPLKFFVPLVVVFILAAVILGAVLLEKQGKYQAKSANGGRITAMVISVVLILTSLGGSYGIFKVRQTMHAVTDEPQITAVVDVYVRKEDPAQKLEDMGLYTLGITSAYDMENTRIALGKMENRVGGSVRTITYETVDQMADALYKGQVDALLINNAYVPILCELEGHNDFTERTRLLAEFSIETDLPDETGSAADPDSTEDQGGSEDEKHDSTLVFYISGSDTRSNSVSSPSRSDVNILAAANLETKEILLLNTPRDYYIPNPAKDGRLDKLTHCGVYGDGVEYSIEALSDLYDIHVDYYARINFTGFETLIDALGGVTVESDASFRTDGGVYIEKGENTLNGREALEFARERHALSNGDIGRGNHQMQVIKAALNKMMSTKIITRYSEILDSLQGMFVTDMPQKKIAELVKMQLDDMASWNIHSYAVDGQGDSKKTASAPGEYLYVMIPDENKVSHAQKLFQMVMDGKKLTESMVNPSEPANP